jgi:hypothetical protein
VHSAAEQRGRNLEAKREELYRKNFRGSKEVYLKVKARIWP